MPDFDANPLIQALDAKRKAAEEAAAAEPKVISITTRKLWEPPAKPKRVRKPKAPKVDPKSVEVLEDAMEQVKAGQLAGTCIIGRRPNGSFFIGVTLPTGKDANNEAAAYVAAAEILKGLMLDINEFGLEPVDETQEILAGDDE